MTGYDGSVSMTDGRAQAFADALQQLEQNSDVERFVAAVFASDVELVRPESQQALTGNSGAQAFWEQYLDYFQTIRSEFSRVVDSGTLGVLEWTSTGQLASGADITYAGVSILDFNSEGRVSRFATYYDTAPFSEARRAG